MTRPVIEPRSLGLLANKLAIIPIKPVIYIYCHPLTDCFVLSQLIGVVRHARCLKRRNFNVYVLIFHCLHSSKWRLECSIRWKSFALREWKPLIPSRFIYIYIYIYYVLLVRVSLALYCLSSLSSIAFGRSSRLHSVSIQCCCR